MIMYAFLCPVNANVSLSCRLYNCSGSLLETYIGGSVVWYAGVHGALFKQNHVT